MNAVITGATKGIGLAIAELFAEHGINLVVNSRKQEDLLALQTRLTQAYPELKVWVFEGDLSKKKDCQDLGAFALASCDNQVDILVNNAGVFLPGVTHLEEDGTLESQIETNLYSAYNVTNSVIAQMIKNKSGHVFNMCSIASKIAYPNGGSYSISKFALLGYTKVLREELKEKGIKVTAILPGATWSNSWAGFEGPEDRLIAARDIALAVYNAVQMSPAGVVEEIVVRPQLGDL